LVVIVPVSRAQARKFSPTRTTAIEKSAPRNNCSICCGVNSCAMNVLTAVQLRRPATFGNRRGKTLASIRGRAAEKARHCTGVAESGAA
jgi:hypothetical protein